MVWYPQNPKIALLDPPMDPILAHFVGKKANFGVKMCFLKKIAPNFCIGSQMVWDPQKPKIGPLYPPMDPIWACFGTSSRHATRLVSHIKSSAHLHPATEILASRVNNFGQWCQNFGHSCQKIWPVVSSCLASGVTFFYVAVVWCMGAA